MVVELLAALLLREQRLKTASIVLQSSSDVQPKTTETMWTGEVAADD